MHKLCGTEWSFLFKKRGKNVLGSRHLCCQCFFNTNTTCPLPDEEEDPEPWPFDSQADGRCCCSLGDWEDLPAHLPVTAGWTRGRASGRAVPSPRGILLPALGACCGAPPRAVPVHCWGTEQKCSMPVLCGARPVLGVAGGARGEVTRSGGLGRGKWDAASSPWPHGGAA